MSDRLHPEPGARDAGRLDDDPRPLPPPCTCTPDGSEVDHRCPRCQSDHEQRARTLDAQARAAYDALLETLPEPCGQQFPEEPPDRSL